MVGLDNSGKTTIIERLKVGSGQIGAGQSSRLHRNTSSRASGRWRASMVHAHTKPPVLGPLLPQPKDKQSIEVAPTVGFTVDEFQKGWV